MHEYILRLYNLRVLVLLLEYFVSSAFQCYTTFQKFNTAQKMLGEKKISPFIEKRKEEKKNTVGRTNRNNINGESYTHGSRTLE